MKFAPKNKAQGGRQPPEHRVSCEQRFARLQAVPLPASPESGLVLPLVLVECDTGAVLGPALLEPQYLLFGLLEANYHLSSDSQTLLECKLSPNKTPRLTTWTRNKALGKRPSPSSDEGRQPGPVSQPPNHKNKSLSEAIYPFKILKFVLDLMNYSK